ncbi:MAG: hypothetical protein NT002_09340 [candidate division Zixibacteria bacterium]|jgi:hypothetical protein|nr:hypothetical protein [candidate division Zixibacteria bacterium]
MPGLICWNCGRATGIEGKPTRSDSCSQCLSDLRTCRGCRFFDPTARWQCRESIEAPIPIKEKSNFCDFFQARLAVHSHDKKQTPIEAKDSHKKKFDDLFED